VRNLSLPDIARGLDGSGEQRFGATRSSSGLAGCSPGGLVSAVLRREDQSAGYDENGDAQYRRHLGEEAAPTTVRKRLA
jgi:hypothetical protein